MVKTHRALWIPIELHAQLLLEVKSRGLKIGKVTEEMVHRWLEDNLQ